MTHYTGGLRQRLIRDSLEAMIRDSLDDLSWFNTDSWFTPVNFLSEQVESSEKIPLNTVALTTENLYADEYELGSDLDEVRWEFFVDIYAEDESTGIHLSGDLLDICKGKMPGIGRTTSNFQVYDYTDDTAPPIFKCNFEDLEKTRVREWDKPHQRYWFIVGGWIIDYYGSEG